MSKSSKHIYASGCSWTQKDWYDKARDLGHHSMWPEIFAHKLGLDAVNHGKGGMGNDYILNRSAEYILDNHDDIELVVIGWSQATRFEIYDSYHFNPAVWLEGDSSDWDTKPRNSGYTWMDQPYDFSKHLVKWMADHNGFEGIYETYVRQIYTLQRLCESLGLKYIFFSALQPITWRQIKILVPNVNMQKSLNHFINIKNFTKIKNFKGWPADENLGGTDSLTYLNEDQLLPDGHPSAEGQIAIANQVYNFYKETYP
jgi:hypothetical protein